MDFHRGLATQNEPKTCPARSHERDTDGFRRRCRQDAGFAIILYGCAGLFETPVREEKCTVKDHLRYFMWYHVVSNLLGVINMRI